jgi:hypothetical protein
MLAGCSTGGCAAVGAYNTLTVELDGTPTAIADVAWVEVCASGGCSTSLSDTGTPVAHPAGFSPPDYIDADDGRGYWVVDVPRDTPERITAAAYAADGTAVSILSDVLTWIDTDTDTDGCQDGPISAGPIRLDLPD